MLNSELITFLAIGSEIFLTVFMGTSSRISVFFSVVFSATTLFSEVLPLRSGAKIRNFFFLYQHHLPLDLPIALVRFLPLI
jgi:hypothetical protein